MDKLISRDKFPLMCMVFAQIPEVYWSVYKKGVYTLNIGFRQFANCFDYEITEVVNDFEKLTISDLKSWYKVFQKIEEVEEIDVDGTTFRKFKIGSDFFYFRKLWRNVFLFAVPYCKCCQPDTQSEAFKTSNKRLKYERLRTSSYMYGDFVYEHTSTTCRNSPVGGRGTSFLVVRHSSYHCP